MKRPIGSTGIPVKYWEMGLSLWANWLQFCDPSLSAGNSLFKHHITCFYLTECIIWAISPLLCTVLNLLHVIILVVHTYNVQTWFYQFKVCTKYRLSNNCDAYNTPKLQWWNTVKNNFGVMESLVKVVHNNCLRGILLSAIVTLKSTVSQRFSAVWRGLIEEQILITEIFTIHWAPFLLQAMKLFILCFVRRQP